jgi:hypothetical protein
MTACPPSFTWILFKTADDGVARRSVLEVLDGHDGVADGVAADGQLRVGRSPLPLPFGSLRGRPNPSAHGLYHFPDGQRLRIGSNENSL